VRIRKNKTKRHVNIIQKKQKLKNEKETSSHTEDVVRWKYKTGEWDPHWLGFLESSKRLPNDILIKLTAEAAWLA